MKKKIMIAVGIITLVLAATMIALANQGQNAMESEYGEPTVMEAEYSLEAPVIEQELSAQDNPVIAAAQAQGLGAYSVAADDRFATLIAEYTMTADEQQYLSELIGQGYDAGWLAEIFEFWVTCCEDKTIIKDIYDSAMENGYADRYWVEDAYNNVTGNIHGVLEGEALYDYLYVDGIEIEDVKTANILCRRGVYTIQELLTKKQEGSTWPVLINEVFGANYGADITAMEAVKQYRQNASGVTLFSAQSSEAENATIAAYADKDTASVSQMIEDNDEAVRQALSTIYDDEILQKYLEQGIDVHILYNAYAVSQSEEIPVADVLYRYNRAGKYARLLERKVVLS